jgi:hypothetical protein
MTPISTTELKATVERDYPPEHPARAYVAALRDEMDPAEYRAQLPVLVRLLRMKPPGSGPP